jgi:hypothetical protein
MTFSWHWTTWKAGSASQQPVFLYAAASSNGDLDQGYLQVSIRKKTHSKLCSIYHQHEGPKQYLIHTSRWNMVAVNKITWMLWWLISEITVLSIANILLGQKIEISSILDIYIGKSYSVQMGGWLGCSIQDCTRTMLWKTSPLTEGKTTDRTWDNPMLPHGDGACVQIVKWVNIYTPKPYGYPSNMLKPKWPG